MTFCELLIFTMITGISAGVVATYVVRLFDKITHKNNRQSE